MSNSARRKVGVGAARIDQQTLLVIRGRFGEFRLGLLGLVGPLEGPRPFIEKLREQIVG